MRVRVNFTIEFDPEDYREASSEELDQEGIRNEVQQRAISDCLLGLADLEVPARLLGKNNVYNPKKRLTGRTGAC